MLTGLGEGQNLLSFLAKRSQCNLSREGQFLEAVFIVLIGGRVLAAASGDDLGGRMLLASYGAPEGCLPEQRTARPHTSVRPSAVP